MGFGLIVEQAGTRRGCIKSKHTKLFEKLVKNVFCERCQVQKTEREKGIAR